MIRTEKIVRNLYALIAGAAPLLVQVRRQRPAHRRPQTPVGAPRRRRGARRVQLSGAGRSSP